MKKIEINQSEKIKSFGSIDKIVKPQGNGAMVLVPKSWIGKRVKVILMESI